MICATSPTPGPIVRKGEDTLKILARLRAAHDYLSDAGYLASAVALTAMCAIYCLEVVLRYFFDSPTQWSTETVSRLMLVMTFLAMPHATRTLAHVSVTLIPDVWPRIARKMGIGLSAVGLVLCGFVTYLSAMESYNQYVQLVETLDNVPVLKWKISIFITYGFGNSALWYLRMLTEAGPIPPRLDICRTSGGALQ